MSHTDKPLDTHPAYGMVSASRVTEHVDLFGVDYPQMHFIRLRVAKGSVRRDLSNDWYYREAEIIELDLSEVQWARLLSSLNYHDGVPCTLRYYPEGPRAEPKMPKRVIQKAQLFKAEVKERLDRALGSISDAITKVMATMEGGRVNKGDMKAILADVQRCHQDLHSNLPYVLGQAEEAIETAVESAKGEIEAYAQHRMQQIGEQALGAHVQRVGVDAAMKQLTDEGATK